MFREIQITPDHGSCLILVFYSFDPNDELFSLRTLSKRRSPRWWEQCDGSTISFRSAKLWISALNHGVHVKDGSIVLVHGPIQVGCRLDRRIDHGLS